jgi:hypothetical protein
MRTLILVVLGGIALFFAWPHFTGVDAAFEEEEASVEDLTIPPPIGTLQALAELEEASTTAEGAEPESGALVEQADPTLTEGNPAGGVPLEVAGDEFDDLDLNALGDPLFEGSLLVHAPGDLQGYLKGKGKEVSKNRKKLLIAYLLIARGQYGQISKYADGLEEAGDVTRDELELLVGCRDGSVELALEAVSKRHKNPLVLGASMSFVERAAREDSMAGDWGGAASLLSSNLLAEIDAPWEADGPSLERWASALHDAQASHRWSPEGSWRFLEVIVEPGDTLVGIRKKVIEIRPNMNLCTGLIERSNQLGRYLRENQVLRIPLDPVRTIIDLSARWLFYLHGNEVVAAWPVAIGRVGQETTPGSYSVGNKTPEPPWFPAGRKMVPYGDPENPLGTRWISLEGSKGLGIHGTWEPDTIGTMASDGCIRLRNELVEQLYEVIPQGSEVVIRP